MPLKIHFLNVGHGDCTIIEHPDGKLTVVDINNGSDLDISTTLELEEVFKLPQHASLVHLPASPMQLEAAGYNIALTNPIAYLQEQFPGKRPFRFILTHPDKDHMTGLAALVNAGLAPTNFWDVENDKELGDGDDWLAYDELRSGSRCTTLKPLREHAHKYYGSDDFGGKGHQIEVLSPTSSIREKANKFGWINELSLVLRVSHAGRSVLLGGDAEELAWNDMVDHYGDGLKSCILKASHHGRESGFHRVALRKIQPLATIVSVGKKPDTDASNLYRPLSGKVWSTRWKGNIIIEIKDDGQIFHSSEHDR